MSTLTGKRLLTAEEFADFCNLPENRDRHFELEQGEAVEMSRPGERHGFVCANVTRILANFTFAQRKGYVCSNDTGLILGRDPDTVRGPDIVYYDAMRRFDELHPRYSETMPTLAVEVLSPHEKWGRVTKRITQFLARGIAVIWLIDPEGRTVTVYRTSQMPQVVEENETLLGDPELPGFSCVIADLFYLPGEDSSAIGSG